MILKQLLLITLLTLAGREASAGQVVEGMVRGVYDGDTILVAIPGQDRLTVRLYGIDAPESSQPERPGQPFGAVARRTLMFKIMGREVTAETMDSDRFGRVVAVVRYKGRDINAEMLAEGMAWAYRSYLEPPYASPYLAAERSARRHRRGLWREADPLPPWEFRKRAAAPPGHRRR